MNESSMWSINYVNRTGSSRLCKLVKHGIENVYQNKYKLFHKIPRTTEIQWLLETTKQK